MLGAFLIVHFAYQLPVVLLRDRATVSNQTTRVGLYRNARKHFVGDIHRHFAVLCRIDLIVDEWRLQGDLPARVAGRGSKRRPIARQHGRGGNEGLCVGRVRAKFCSLVPAKKEQLILHDRPAHCSTVLVTLQ